MFLYANKFCGVRLTQRESDDTHHTDDIIIALFPLPPASANHSNTQRLTRSQTMTFQTSADALSVLEVDRLIGMAD